MIKALMLIIDPVPTWGRIAADRRQWRWILAVHLIPLLVLAGLIEGYGLVHWGKARAAFSTIRTFSLPHALVFEVAQLLLSVFVVYLGARLIKSLGDTFHGRHNFGQAFTVAAYGLSPLFLFRLFNALPGLSPWLTYAVGIIFCAAILYHGLPRVMEPDPPHAFGLYLMSVVLLSMITGLACFLTTWYLLGKFAKLDAFIARFISP
jgi:hypothetical protein